MGPKLVIVGGGYVGTEVARRLDATFEVTLIEARKAFIHVPAMIRSLMEPALLDRAILPYDRLLKRGRVLNGLAVELRPDGVKLAGGEFVAGDLILTATGSTYGSPFKPTTESLADFRNVQYCASAKIKAAQNIAVIGAGPVGVELAGELKWAYPDKVVTLVSDARHLIPAHPARLGRAIEAKLQGMGVRLVAGTRAKGVDLVGAPFDGPVELEDGSFIDADLVVQATGSWGNAGLLLDLPGVRQGSRGRVQTDEWLRPSNWPNLFTAGDAADVGDAMTIVATMRQVPFLLRAFRNVVAGHPVERLRPYLPWRVAPILLPLGPKFGNSLLPLPSPISIQGDIVTRNLKGRHLFIPKYRRAFGLGDVDVKSTA